LRAIPIPASVVVICHHHFLELLADASTANVEGEERRITTCEEHLIELRTTSVVEASDFSVEDDMC
jgi:hypothetical protein